MLGLPLFQVSYHFPKFFFVKNDKIPEFSQGVQGFPGLVGTLLFSLCNDNKILRSLSKSHTVKVQMRSKVQFFKSNNKYVNVLEPVDCEHMPTPCEDIGLLFHQTAPIYQIRMAENNSINKPSNYQFSLSYLPLTIWETQTTVPHFYSSCPGVGGIVGNYSLTNRSRQLLTDLDNYKINLLRSSGCEVRIKHARTATFLANHLFLRHRYLQLMCTVCNLTPFY